MNIQILVMAAGASRRLGQPKQLLMLKGKSLLAHTIEVCLSANIGDVLVCLGSTANKIAAAIAKYPTETIICEHWHKGLGATIAYAVQHSTSKNIDGVLIVLADQPYLTAPVLQQILKKVTQTKTSICASNYAEGKGPPVYFHRSLFGELAQLKGDTGAKPVVKKYQSTVQYVDFPNGNIDIDTLDDLKYLT